MSEEVRKSAFQIKISIFNILRILHEYKRKHKRNQDIYVETPQAANFLNQRIKYY